MSTAETPQFEGPLENPDWTEEENRRFDTLDQGGGFPMDMARAAARRLANQEVGYQRASSAQKKDPPGLYDKQTPNTSNRIKETPEGRAAREQAMRDKGILPAA